MFYPFFFEKEGLLGFDEEDFYAIVFQVEAFTAMGEEEEPVTLPSDIVIGDTEPSWVATIAL